eukprot:7967371-Pyramimonas_sp.AAC.1
MSIVPGDEIYDQLVQSMESSSPPTGSSRPSARGHPQTTRRARAGYDSAPISVGLTETVAARKINVKHILNMLKRILYIARES